VFDRLAGDMPCVSELAAKGTWGRLRSSVPPTTIPAWVSMFTGLDPGQLGIYGFRDRDGFTYSEPRLATSRSTDAPRVWDRLSQAGLTSYVLGVPGTYPPWQIRGRMVSSFLAPGTDVEYTFPASLKQEIESISDGYMLDVDGFRTEKKDWLRDQIVSMTEKRFKVARAWAKETKWDLMIACEIGTDRIHHGFWSSYDPGHRSYEPGNRFSHVIPDYYRSLDTRIAEVIEAAGPSTAVMIVSDHGAKAMQGGFRINEWLAREGDLALKKRPASPRPLQAEDVDWERTRAWGAGGYCAKIFFNISGREPQGLLSPSEVPGYRSDLAARLEKIRDASGNPMDTRVFSPLEIYGDCRAYPPDLIAYLGNLSWRSLAEVGSERLHSLTNDTGPDDANHAEDGIFICFDPDRPDGGQKEDGVITDITSRILAFFDLDP